MPRIQVPTASPPHIRVCLNGCEDQEVLQVAVVAECRVLEHNLLEQLNELVGEVCRHERLDRHRHILGVRRFGKRRLNHLVNDLPPRIRLLSQHLRPQIGIPPADQVPRLALPHLVAVGQPNQLLVAQPALVRNERHVRVPLLAVRPDHVAVIVRVLPAHHTGYSQRLLQLTVRHAR